MKAYNETKGILVTALFWICAIIVTAPWASLGACTPAQLAAIVPAVVSTITELAREECGHDDSPESCLRKCNARLEKQNPRGQGGNGGFAGAGQPR